MNKKLRLLGAMLVGLFFAGNSYAENKMIQIKGSDTEINLVQRLAESFMEKNPGNAIAVTGGGSGTGIAALINKGCDIANSSREMKTTEIEQAAGKGIDADRVIIAVDGLAVITNADNYVKRLTLEEVGKIFKGEIKNWKELGNHQSMG